MRESSEVLWYNLQNNPLFFIETLLYIKTIAKEVTLFKLNETQLRIYGKVEKLRKEKKPVRIIILKARQTGVSTLTEALIFQDTVVNDNVLSMIIAHDHESTGHLFRMSKLFYSKMDKDIYKPMTKRSNKIEILFENPNPKLVDTNPGLNSIIRVDTANNLQAGRAFTLQNLHCSELAFWEKPEEVMDGLMQSIHDVPETMIIIESTANGVGNYFHSIWEAAQKGENDYIPIFIPWYEDNEYRLMPPKDFELSDYEHEVYGNELKLKELFKLDNEQLYWRRYTIKNKLNSNIDKFHQEFPITPDEAFLTSGSNIFDKFLITIYSKLTKKPERGELEKDFKFTRGGRGNFRIWKEPEPGNKYSIGADVAEGLGGGDYSCAEVFDKKNFEQVAEWHGKIPPDKFAYVLKLLAQYYNEALVVVESNDQGLVTLSYLKPIWYRIYYRREFDKRDNKITRQMGFRTTGKSKPILIGDFNKLFREEELILNSQETISEMSYYIEDKNGRLRASKSSKTKIARTKEYDSAYFDDRIIAACLAIQGLSIVYLDDINKVSNMNGYKANNPLTGY